MKDVPKIVVSLTSLCVVLFYVQAIIRNMLAGYFGLTAIALWFFGVGTMAIIELKLRTSDKEWTKSTILLLVALSAFAWNYYPRIRSSWGGGAPVDITMYFRKESAFKPNQRISALLLDESDEGWYIVGRNEQKAIFIPRNDVGLVYFSDKVDSVLLQ